MADDDGLPPYEELESDSNSVLAAAGSPLPAYRQDGEGSKRQRSKHSKHSRTTETKEN